MMLRAVVLIIAIIAFAGALTGTLVDIGVWPSLLFTVVLLIGILFERVRYGAAQRRPVGDAWQETTERFIDDESGRPVPSGLTRQPASVAMSIRVRAKEANAIANELQK